MRIRLILCLLLLFPFVACSNKGQDQGTASTAPNAQPTGTPPASSETGNATSAAATPLSGSPMREARRSGTETAALEVVIPAGTAITVRTQNSLSSGTNHAGDTFDANVSAPVMVNGKEVIPSGARAQGTVAEAQAKGKIKGAATLRLELTSIAINGTSYPVQTSMAGFSAKGKGKRTAVTTGGGAALGALIGGLAGGGKGAAIGAVAGGGAGLAGGALTGNQQIQLPAETALTFKLKESVTLK